MPVQSMLLVVIPVYVIGGDGSQRAANDLYLEAKRRQLKIALIGVPKTIDNDVGLIDR